MRIHRVSRITGASRASGLAVVIDVFRASTTITAMLAGGVRRIIPVASLREARRLKNLHPRYLLAGERGGVAPPGFDLGNSPMEAERAKLRGRTVVLTTSAGTRGIEASVRAGARDVLIACFANASGAVREIRRRSPEEVTLIAMGVAGRRRANEDEACAAYIEALLLGRKPDFRRIRATLLRDPEAVKFLDPEGPVYYPKDPDVCLQLDRYRAVGTLTPRGIQRARSR